MTSSSDPVWAQVSLEAILHEANLNPNASVKEVVDRALEKVSGSLLPDSSVASETPETESDAL